MSTTPLRPILSVEDVIPHVLVILAAQSTCHFPGLDPNHSPCPPRLDQIPLLSVLLSPRSSPSLPTGHRRHLPGAVVELVSTPRRIEW